MILPRRHALGAGQAGPYRTRLISNPARQQLGGLFPKEMGAAIVAGLQKMFGSPVRNFDELHSTWSAVHANFVCPRLPGSGADYGDAPYSIADSAPISSCCVELFNMLGSQEPLLVRPCIGGVIVKALEKDRYYLMQPARTMTYFTSSKNAGRSEALWLAEPQHKGRAAAEPYRKNTHPREPVPRRHRL